jgi:photosystem I P700 chlorophyll a apoprotein A2
MVDVRQAGFFHELGNIHDLEASQENRLALTTHLFLSHWVHLSVLMFWVAENLFHIGWNGNLELWILNPIANMPIFLCCILFFFK